MTNDLSKLTQWQQQLRAFAQNLVPSKPPEPWSIYHNVFAAGIFAAGWTSKENFVMLSLDGYSINNPLTGEQILFDEDVDTMLENVIDGNLRFRMPHTNETILLFGSDAGDGLHILDDWKVRIIYPWWPNATIVMYRSTLQNFDTVYALNLEVCDAGNWIKCGFSPSGKTLAIVGHAGAEFFSRNQ